MSKLYIFLILTCLVFVSEARQNDLKQAIKHYNAKNLGLAEREIEDAVQTTFSSEEELAEAMYYYFMIKADLYGTKENLPNNVDRLGRLGDAYVTCAKNDPEKKFTPELNERVEAISVLLSDQAITLYAAKNYLEYFHVLDYRLSFLEMIDGENGKEYQELVQHADLLGLTPLKIKYLKKMIKSDYHERYAYRELLASLYDIGKYSEVDALLKEAKEAFPEANDFAAIEIKRLSDKELKFSALQLAKSTVQKDPLNAPVVYLLGVLHASLNEHEEALLNFQKAEKLDSNHFETHLELGKFFYKFSAKSGYLDSAKVHLEKAHAINQDLEVTRELLNDIYTELGLIQEKVNLSSY